MSDELEAPPRLIEMPGAAGDCLRQAVQEQSASLTVPRFAELRERRHGRARRQRGLLLAACVAATLIGAAALRPQEPPASIHAEVASVARHGEPLVPGATPAAAEMPKALVELEPDAPTTAPSSAVVSAPKPRAITERAAEPAPPNEANLGVQADSNRGARACAELTRSGAAEQALGCYEELAQGSGMVAELALFEQARLEGKMMRRPGRALRKLESYRERFPHGSLRGEVMLAQIEWLLAVGDNARARRVVDEALGSGLLRERTVELERLRTTLTESPAPPR